MSAQSVTHLYHMTATSPFVLMGCGQAGFTSTRKRTADQIEASATRTKSTFPRTLRHGDTSSGPMLGTPAWLACCASSGRTLSDSIPKYCLDPLGSRSGQACSYARMPSRPQPCDNGGLTVQRPAARLHAASVITENVRKPLPYYLVCRPSTERACS